MLLAPLKFVIWLFCLRLIRANLTSDVYLLFLFILKWPICVCEFHITCQLLSCASGGGAMNSSSQVLNMGISYWADDKLTEWKLYPVNQSLSPCVSNAHRKCAFCAMQYSVSKAVNEKQWRVKFTILKWWNLQHTWWGIYFKLRNCSGDHTWRFILSEGQYAFFSRSIAALCVHPWKKANQQSYSPVSSHFMLQVM